MREKHTYIYVCKMLNGICQSILIIYSSISEYYFRNYLRFIENSHENSNICVTSF